MSEVYKPTQLDREIMKFSPNHLKVSGDSIFLTFQGEGQTMGKPAIFLRLQTCNLRCGINGGWQCDTPYAVFPDREDYWKEPKDLTPEYVAKMARSIWPSSAAPRLVITGGEPMIQQKNITKLVNLMPEADFEVETNGTISPNQELADMVQFNVSPKLENSGNPLAKRFRLGVLQRLNELDKTTFKFVVKDKPDIDEVDKIVDEVPLNQDKIIIMPEGVTVEALRSHARRVEPYVQEKGWRLLDRMQIALYGNTRGT